LKNKFRNLSIAFLLFFLMINAIPNVLSKTRNAYLTSYILNNEIKSSGFSNAISGNKEVSFEATAYAIDILKFYGKKPAEIELLQERLDVNVTAMFDNDDVDLYDLYFLLKSLELLDYSIETNLVNRIYTFLNDTKQVTGGFSLSNTSTSVSIISTFYVIQLFLLIDKPIENTTLQTNWVLSCNNDDGGFGGNTSLPSTLTNTYYALTILNKLGDLNVLSDSNKTINYLKSFYVSDSADLDDFGGYLPDEVALFALLSSTYFCVEAISLINENELSSDSTTAWVLDRQAVQDGGFVDNTHGNQKKLSSVTTSYYAFKTLEILKSLSKLKQEIGMVEFNFLILGIVLISIVFVIAISIYIWRKRRI